MKDFAETLKAIRVANHLYQKDVCQDICSLREYQRIEADSSEPSNYVLRKISQRLGYDFEAYYFRLMTNGENEVFYEQRKELNRLSTERNYPLLHKKIRVYADLPMYRLFENKKMLLHYDSIYYASYEKDYDKSNELCLEIIRDDDPNATLDDFCSRIFSKYAIYSAHIIGLNYSAQGNEEKMIQIYNELIDRINELDRDEISSYQSNKYRRNLHQTLLYNLSINYQKSCDLENSERCIDSAIEYAAEYSTLFMLAKICGQKAQILCHKEEYDEANTYLGLASGLFVIQKQPEESKKILSLFRENFPKLI